MDKIKILQKKIKIEFKNQKILLQAITHKSFDPNNNYENLEFLGDRVLGLVVSKRLFELFPNEKVGSLDKKLASLVNKNKCFEIHNNLAKNSIESIIDDRDESAGKKFSDSDLIGFPATIIVGPSELENDNVEIRFRKEGSNQILPYSNVLTIIKNKLFEE